MTVTIADIEELINKIAGTIAALKTERDQLRAQVNDLKVKCSEKDLESIRTAKEGQRALEMAERERLASKKEKEQMEAKLRALYKRLSTLVPETDAEGRSTPPQPREERRG